MINKEEEFDKFDKFGNDLSHFLKKNSHMDLSDIFEIVLGTLIMGATSALNDKEDILLLKKATFEVINHFFDVTIALKNFEINASPQEKFDAISNMVMDLKKDLKK